MKKIRLVLLTFALCMIAISMNAQSYVDLGLPSGTQWKTTNEAGFYTYGQALMNFGLSLPSKQQWKELIDYCEWNWTGRGYKLTGPNGRNIFLPAEGMSYFQRNETYGVGERGCYYTFDHGEDGYDAWCVGFDQSTYPKIFWTDDLPKKAFSTRLIKK